MMQSATTRYRSLHRANARRTAALRQATAAAAEVAPTRKPFRSNKAVRMHVRRALASAA